MVEIGDRVRVGGCHKNFTPRVRKIEGGMVLVRADGGIAEMWVQVSQVRPAPRGKR